MSTNKEFAKSLKTPAASFYLCDFHVHSPGSADSRIGDRFAALSNAEQALIPKLDALPNDLASYDKQMLANCPVESFYQLLLSRRNDIVGTQMISEGKDWAFVSITDHNVAEYAAELSKHAWHIRKQNRLVILPGIELDVSFSSEGEENNVCTVHLLCIFPPLTTASDIRIAINNASCKTWSFGSGITVDSLPHFVDELRHHSSYPAICIAAHVASSKGLHNELKKSLLNNLDAAIARTTGEIASGLSDTEELKKRIVEFENKRDDRDVIHDQVLRHIGSCGLDALQVKSKQDEKHYRRLHRFKPEKGRAVPITCSDAHSVSNVFTNDDALSFLKLSGMTSSLSPKEMFDEIRDRGLRYGDTRFSYSSPGYVSKWIAGIEVTPDAPDAEQFWPFVLNNAEGSAKSFMLPFSRNLNCLIGGRGSGKSAAIEAIAFVSQPDDFNNQGKKKDSERPEWYSRAYATLRGCLIRTCWKSTGEGEFTTLEKKTLFASRYFDPKHQHGEVRITDIEEKEILSHSVSPPKVTLFRIHEIEEAAQPEKLRDLFDRIHGDEVFVMNQEIGDIRDKLKLQRSEMIKVASLISTLTEEKTPLREFIKRKLQFLEVDKTEVKQKYETVDAASAAESIANDAVEDWRQVPGSLAASSLSDNINHFFSQLATNLKTDTGAIKANCQQLFPLVDEATTPSRRQKIVGAIDAVDAEVKTFGKDLSDSANAIAELHKNAREQLTKDGLPSGGKDREAKKKAYGDAVRALGEYNSLCEQWGAFFTERKKLHEELKTKCIARTKLRQETAEMLTRDLAKDLDSSVLVVEADAQPVADKDEFVKWLTDNLASKASMKFRIPRIKAIVAKGVMPSELRDLVLSEANANQSLLLVNQAKAEDGKITIEDHQKIVEETVGRCRCLPEMSEDDMTAQEWSDLPGEIKNGLWYFPVEASGRAPVKVSAALQLDEIVFDDVPIIRLNDRPNDAGSIARPLNELSRGQRCSAILPILLLTGRLPLVIDQPEDNLDNRLIRQVVVNILASMKLRRQVIVATHNPNLPVLGDAEQAIILRAVRDRGCALEACGHLDSKEVVKYVTDIMEGGREAFQYRQSIYQSHWDGPISEEVSKLASRS